MESPRPSPSGLHAPKRARTLAEPFKIKMVEPLTVTTEEYRPCVPIENEKSL